MQKYLLVALLTFSLTIGYAQDLTQAQIDNIKLSSVLPGNTKFFLTGVGWIGFQAHLNSHDETLPKTTFNDYGFSPMLLWKLSDKFFFESEIEIKNDGTPSNGVAFDLEFAKMSFIVNKYITIGAGKMLSPFGAYNERWEPNHIEKFANAPLRPDDGILPDDTHLFWGAMLGVDVRGCIPIGRTKLNYVAYLSNGPQLNTDLGMGGMIQYENWNDNNSNKQIGGRIGFLPFTNSSLEVGVSAQYGKAGNQGDSIYKNIAATAWAVDLSYVKAIEPIKSIINFRGQFNELMVDKANYKFTDSTYYTFDNTMQSWFAQFSIRPSMLRSNFFKRIELMCRYSMVNPPKDALWCPKDKNGAGGSINRLDLGLCYWISWRTGLRFAYEVQNMPDGTKQKEILIRLATGF